MATVTEYDSATTQSTNNQATYNSGNIAPSIGQLLVVAVIASGTVDGGVVTAAANGVTTFHPIARAGFQGDTNSVYLFVADHFTTGTSTMQVTFDCTGDDATGAIVLVSALNSMSKVGSAAVRQFMVIENGAGATTPDWPGFGAACLTSNITMYVLGELSTGGVLNPTNWTQGAAGSYSTPTMGGAYGYRNSGFTGTDVTWPGNETQHGGIFVEFDCSADPARTKAKVYNRAAIVRASIY